MHAKNVKNSQLHDKIEMRCTFKDVLQRDNVGVFDSEEDKWTEIINPNA